MMRRGCRAPLWHAVMVWVVERCRRRFFFNEKMRFWSWNVAAGAFFCEKTVFWCWNVAAGSFFVKKMCFGAGTLPQAP